MLRLFVYGTLKRGFWNHDRFCRGVLTVEDAVVRGRLFETSSGIPVLQVPEEDILAVGTTDPLADVATQAHVTARMSNPEPTPDRLPKKGTGAPLGPRVRGASHLRRPRDPPPGHRPAGGFHPGGPCLYRRVLILSRPTESCSRPGSMLLK
ncbi:MAG: gamma-glutamylcyclotransferase [Desulfobacterales bacterium]|nr:gamma-glutamylcyclotransferase [Desulfobacterales bacterium]